MMPGGRGEETPDLRPDEVLRSLMRSYKLVTLRLESAFARAGAPSLIESVVLTQLHRAPERRLPLQALGRNLPHITKSGVTRLIDRMEADGLVQRQYSSADKRVTFAAITARGTTALRFAASVFRDAYAAAFEAALSPEEIRELVRLLDKLARTNQAPAANQPGANTAHDFLLPEGDEDLDPALPLDSLEVWRIAAGQAL